MDVTSLTSLYGTTGLLPARAEGTKNTLSTPGSEEGDSVSISETARSLLARSTSPFKKGESAAGADTSAQSTAGAAAGNSGAAGAAGGGGGGGEDDSASKMESLEEQIQQLQNQYQSVMKAPGDERVKEAQGGALQQQISALEQQLNEIKMSSLKKA